MKSRNLFFYQEHVCFYSIGHIHNIKQNNIYCKGTSNRKNKCSNTLNSKQCLKNTCFISQWRSPCSKSIKETDGSLVGERLRLHWEVFGISAPACTSDINFCVTYSHECLIEIPLANSEGRHCGETVTSYFNLMWYSFIVYVL